KPAASVHPEPGSNSPLYKMFCSKSLALISKVLFEITLRREWENFSCSNTSKNAVRYIAIKNISVSVGGLPLPVPSAAFAERKVVQR
ncbi:hypothetical protein, partial [uncultured Alistipes sp.]|uniref:hypothetical protein n=1 Tax=uncultured Alistipes sp. TaxID=538949 RepID=UPI0025829F19